MSAEVWYQPTAQYSTDEFWQDLIDKEGVEAAIEFAVQMRAGPVAYAEKVISRHLKIKEMSRPERQEAQDKVSIEIARKANRIAERSILKARRANAISIFSALLTVVAIAVAIFKE